MKITSVDLFEVEIPPIPSIAKYVPKIYDITLGRIQTDEGLTGWGECNGPRTGGEEKAASLVGEDPMALDPFAQPDWVTCALLDISGQAFGLPVHRFFGQKLREQVPVSYWSCHMEPHETAKEAKIGVSKGFTNHKLKARSWDIVETVRLMKEAAGSDYSITVDPNTEFGRPHVAARLASELEPFGTVSVFEDPMLKNNLDWYRLLRQKTFIPLALHMGSLEYILRALKAECVDCLNIGGTSQHVKKGAALAEAAEIPIWTQMGGLCLGVLAAYSTHVQCTIPNATLPCDELPFVRVADVLEGGLDLKDGHFTVPEGPGLGVTVNMEIVEKYRVA